jgi:ADP-ribosylglycohydrolase
MQDYLNKARAGVLASLAADSLCLAPHWIYDVSEIQRRFGRITDLAAPSPDSHHRGKKAGEFTHYGDQELVLLESLGENGAFDLRDFFRRWRLLFTDYGGYLDRATRQTLSRIEQGHGPEESGSASHDLAGASRIASLPPYYPEDLKALVAAARAQTKMTHNEPLVIDSAEFFARAAHLTAHGESPVRAMKQSAEASYLSLPASKWLEQGLAFADGETLPAVLNFGQSCNVQGAFRSVVQITARHENDLEAALIENAMAGGDSAARGMLAGMLIGAHLGPGAIPERWVNGLAAGDRIRELLPRP